MSNMKGVACSDALLFWFTSQSSSVGFSRSKQLFSSKKPYYTSARHMSSTTQ